jgi:hypothetical protein
METDNIDIIELENFKILHIKSKPQRIEAKVVFDRDNISQKLIFTLMDIAHIHGFGCSAPMFKDLKDPSMTFLIGTILPSSRSLNKYLRKIHMCLCSIAEFAQEFSKQLDFSQLDLTMFSNMGKFYPEQFAAIRDQHYGGSWKMFHDNMVMENRNDEAKIVECCVRFEEINQKDIGLIGHKLSYILDIVNVQSGCENFETN